MSSEIETKLFQLLESISTELKNDFKKVNSQLAIIDKRLSLIEQRLANIEPWVSVDNKHLQYEVATA